MNLRLPFSISDMRLCALHTFIIVPVVAFLAFYNLHTGANLGTGTGIDESWYIQVSQEMSQSGQWWLPTREGEPFFYKPPLKFWLTSLSAGIFGDSIVAYRAVDAVCGALIVLLTYITATTVFASLNAGFFASLSLLATQAFLFLNGIRFATLDTLVMLFDILALLILARLTLLDRDLSAQEQTKWGAAAGVLLGLAALTKSVLGFYVVGVYALWLLLCLRPFSQIWKLRRLFLVAGAVALFIPALWFVPHSLSTPGAFDRMFGDEIVRRFEHKFHNANNWALYWDAFVGQRYLPFYTAVIALVVLSIRSIVQRNRTVALFLVWAIFPFCVFTALSSRLLWYVAPCYFPAAIISGGFISLCIEKTLESFSCAATSVGLLRRLVTSVLCGVAAVAAVAETGCYLGRNMLRVWQGSPRLAIDELVAELKKSPQPLVALRYNAPSGATRERIFLNMLDQPPRTVADEEHVIAAATAADAYVIFADLQSAANLSSKLSFSRYRYLPPVTFPQGPQGVYRFGRVFALIGAKKPESLKSLALSPRKIVMKPRNDGTRCEPITNDPAKHSNPWVSSEAKHTILCQFEGDPLLGAVPSKLKLSIGRLTQGPDASPPLLSVNANYRSLGTIAPFHKKPGLYEFSVPQATWLDGTNAIYLSFVDAKGSPTDPLVNEANRLLVRWITLEF